MPCRAIPGVITAILLLFSPRGAAGQESRNGRGPQELADSVAVAELSRALTAGLATDSARAAVLYEWVARNVAYDVGGYLEGRIGGETAESVFRRREAVCGGYVALYGRLAAEAGLETAAIQGYAKGFDYAYGQPTRHGNHAWLAVRVEGHWRLVDPTWGAGAVRDGRFEPAFTWAYFLVDAEELILSHLPEQAVWQMVAQPLRRHDFERMAAVPRSLLEVGFTAAALRTAALTAGGAGFPEVGPQGPDVRVVRAPLTGTIRREAPVDVEVVWPGAADVAVVTGNVWTHLARAGDVFHGRALAGDGTVWVVGRTGVGASAYRTLLHYRVR
jgi:hypothetical protein